MILQALTQYYETLVQAGVLAGPPPKKYFWFPFVQ